MTTALAVVASLGGVLALIGAVVTVIRAIFRQVRATDELTRAVTDLRVSMTRHDDRIANLAERIAHLEGEGPVKVLAASAVIVAAFLVSIGGSYLLGLHALHQSQAQWCTTLTLLTSRPVPKPADPAANPSRVQAYVFYVHLRDLERAFGC